MFNPDTKKVFHNYMLNGKGKVIILSTLPDWNNKTLSFDSMKFFGFLSSIRKIYIILILILFIFTIYQQFKDFSYVLPDEKNKTPDKLSIQITTIAKPTTKTPKKPSFVSYKNNATFPFEFCTLKLGHCSK